MSSNQRIQKVCLHEPCSKLFIAQKVTTKFCSLICAQRDYKLQQRKMKLKVVEVETTARLEKVRESIVGKDEEKVQPDFAPELVDIKGLSKITTISERTLYRLMEEDDKFPKQKIRKNLRFNKDDVLAYFKTRFGAS